MRDSDLLLQLLDLPEKNKKKKLEELIAPSDERNGNHTRTGTEVYYAVHNRPMESMHKKASHHRFETMTSM